MIYKTIKIFMNTPEVKLHYERCIRVSWDFRNFIVTVTSPTTTFILPISGTNKTEWGLIGHMLVFLLFIILHGLEALT